MIEYPLFTVDAFTEVPFRGNPASVCLLDRDLPEKTMQAIAAEMNHSETAFLCPLDSPPKLATRYSLRWFTPQVEVPLCGHATLATAAVLFYEVENPAPEIRFDTKSGTLAARREGARIALDFPAEDFSPTAARPEVLEALGAHGLEGAFYARGDRNLLLHLTDEDEVRNMDPDFDLLRKARGDQLFLGVIVTARASGAYDFVSRYFAPWIGIDEDPVTGSAHCALTPYWARITGKNEMRAYQASRRGGELTVRLKGNRVGLLGAAVVLTAGALRLGDDAE
jgi:PhzF family phenazine biosynthesis protein